MTAPMTDTVVRPSTAPSQRLRATTVAARVSLAWLGTRKTLSTDQKALAAGVFRDSAVSNLREFFERFRQLNVRSSEQLDEVVEMCQRMVGGVEPQLLRDNQGLRRQVASQLSQVQNLLEDLLVDRPRRNILRRSR